MLSAVKFMLVRLIGGVIQPISPGDNAVDLMIAGRRLLSEHPGWLLQVRDADQKIIWKGGEPGEGS